MQNYLHLNIKIFWYKDIIIFVSKIYINGSMFFKDSKAVIFTL